jgi:histidinol-phosphate aminotransferase
VKKTLSAITPKTKMLFICSPNNPSGNLMSKPRIRELLNNFDGIVIVDEAYIDFSNDPGMLPEIANYQNLVVLRTFSKAWGMANIRLGMAFANPKIIQYMSNVKPPYNVNGVTQQIALKSLQNIDKKDQMIQKIIDGRDYLQQELLQFKAVEKIYPSDSNFLLVKFQDSDKVFDYLMNEKIIVRNRSSQLGCNNCLRITVGTKNENEKLISTLNRFYKQ